MNTMLELRKRELEKRPDLTFGDFHSIVSKSMPDVTRFPEMYNLCYDLMKLAWETSERITNKRKANERTRRTA